MAITSAEERQCHGRVSGRVQGVGFRFFVQREATRLGLRGWVRNREDGDVEFVARGPADAVDALLRRVREGPPLAWVQSVSVEWQTPSCTARSFEVKPTAW